MPQYHSSAPNAGVLPSNFLVKLFFSATNGARPHFRDVDWGTIDNGKMLRDKVSGISKCASDVEKLVDGYLEEHSKMQKKLKASSKVEPITVPTVKTRIPRNCGKSQVPPTNGASESSGV
ncbi:uncharacterized protein DFL_003035 [Arthrobotrys flagrans]|uniref:Uncharacterized protein n=1 Tax=Arthrobotrys flagrans TaxID=97331 RepID=A0A437AC85_ARTFL|nr:hypothetical protein DFL_003035 [Arthrobotrys flagrans]